MLENVYIWQASAKCILIQTSRAKYCKWIREPCNPYFVINDKNDYVQNITSLYWSLWIHSCHFIRIEFCHLIYYVIFSRTVIHFHTINIFLHSTKKISFSFWCNRKQKTSSVDKNAFFLSLMNLWINLFSSILDPHHYSFQNSRRINEDTFNLCRGQRKAFHKRHPPFHPTKTRK